MNTPNSIPPKPRRKYDRHFKAEAVNHWLQSGKSAQDVAAELGIGTTRLYAWHKKLHPTGPSEPPSVAELEEQNAALRRENEQLRQQRDILKKTLGILSEVPSNATNGSRS